MFTINYWHSSFFIHLQYIMVYCYIYLRPISYKLSDIIHCQFLFLYDWMSHFAIYLQLQKMEAEMEYDIHM